MYKPTIMLLTLDEALRRTVQEILRCPEWDVVTIEDITKLLLAIQHTRPALIILGAAQERAWHGVELAQDIHCQDSTVPVILLMPHSSEELAIAALRAGVSDYFKIPLSDDALLVSVRRCLVDSGAQAAPTLLATTTACPSNGSLLVGNSPSMRQIKAYIEQVASTDCNVLITGETGTGKEVVAALLHQHSPRRQQPLRSINCAAIPDSLLESELFGYERGAFTGAHTANAGVLQHAEGGTVFFDEIGDMTPYAQAKILRAIDNKEVQRLGGKRLIPLDIRLIAATNGDVEHLVSTGTFRKDLYFRLNVARIHMPPLRDRREDIPLLLEHYIQDANRRFGRQVENFTEEALTLLLHYDWPGNVRELKNLVEASFINLPLRQTTLRDLPHLFHRQHGEATDTPQNERARVLSALSATHWNKSKAAQKLRWSRMTLYRKLAKHHIVSASEGEPPENPL